MSDAGPTATLLVNENARGVARRFDAPLAAEYLRAKGWATRLIYPETAASAGVRAREAAERGDEFLFVAGGDGTLRDAAIGVVGSDTALAPIPMGTVNVFAREMGIPRDPYRAIDTHIEGQRVRIDAGWATRPDGTRQCFLLMAGVGWDAEIARSVNPVLKRRVGDAAYILRAASALPGLRPVHARWRVGREEREGPLALIVMHNTRLYGGMVRFAPDAIADDGLLDVVALCPENVVDGARIAAKVATGHLGHDPCIHSARTSEVVIETEGIPVQLDGDFAGETPMHFAIEARALPVSVPAGALPAVILGRVEEEAAG